MPKQVMVVFDKSSPPYWAGERAMFPPKVAERLEKAGLAHVASKKEAAKTEKAKQAEEPAKVGDTVVFFVEGEGDHQGEVKSISGDDCIVTCGDEDFEASLKELRVARRADD